MQEPCTHLFALEGTQPFGAAIARYLGTSLRAHEERAFDDGEHKARPLVSVRGGRVVVVHALYADAVQSVHDRLCRLLFFIGTLNDAGAAHVTAVIPYLCYARKDQQTKPRDPVTTRYVAALFEAVGTDRLVTVDVHNLAAFQNAFRIPTTCVEARPLFADYFAQRLRGEAVTVGSPDLGGIKRAEGLRRALSEAWQTEVPSAFMEKQRSEGVVTGRARIGDVEGRTVVLIDDMIATGTTLVRAIDACRASGAERVIVAATHGLFVGGAPTLFHSTPPDGMVITNTVAVHERLPEDNPVPVQVLDVAPLVAEALRGPEVAEIAPTSPSVVP